MPLNNGWNLIAYLRFIPLDIEIALQDVGADLLIVKDENGSIYWPDFGINNIGDMMPGKGYQIYMDNIVNLNYPGN